MLLLDAGDTLFSDQPLAEQTQGKAIVEAMNLLGYDAMVLGGEDFRLGLDVLRQRMTEAQFPILSANVVMAETNQLFATPYVIKEIGGRQVGIIGLTDQRAARAARGAVAVLDPLEVLQDVLDEISKKADIIILLSHLGTEVDIQLANQVEGIDLIVGGNSHDVLSPPLWLEDRGTVIAQAGVEGQYIGVVRLEIDNLGQVASHQGECVLLTQDFADDPEMRAFLDQYK